jgi:quercetin dioxygenase-like cupin family protein
MEQSATYSRTAPNVRIVHEACDCKKFPGIDTFEGRASPLIIGETMLAQSLEIPAGLRVPEHPEPEESMVYTVSGRWILKVDGQEHRMGPGSLHWLGKGTSAGCEVPYDKPALVLSFVRIGEKGSPHGVLAISVKDVRIVARNAF